MLNYEIKVKNLVIGVSTRKAQKIENTNDPKYKGYNWNIVRPRFALKIRHYSMAFPKSFEYILLGQNVKVCIGA